jgi:hypothetical protein
MFRFFEGKWVSEDDMKAKDNPIQEINQNDLFVLDSKGNLKQILRLVEPKDQQVLRQEFELEYNKAIEIAKGKDWQHAMFQQYGLRDGKPPTGNDAWVIPYCIDELLKANEELKQDTSKLSLGVQKSNRAFMVALRHLMGETPRTTVPIKDNNKVKQTPIRRSIHFNYQETDGREPLGDIELFHSYQVDELTPEFYKEMQVKALSQLREIEAKAGRYEILIWHGEKIAGTDTGTLVLLRKEPS